MGALLDWLGPCRCTYGSAFSIEPAREAEAETIPGVRLLSVRPVVGQAVDFSRWPSWQAYNRDISENSRRNAKAALKRFPDLVMDTRVGRAAMSLIPDLARLREGLPWVSVARRRS